MCTDGEPMDVRLTDAVVTLTYNCGRHGGIHADAPTVILSIRRRDSQITVGLGSSGRCRYEAVATINLQRFRRIIGFNWIKMPMIYVAGRFAGSKDDGDCCWIKLYVMAGNICGRTDHQLPSME